MKLLLCWNRNLILFNTLVEVLLLDCTFISYFITLILSFLLLMYSFLSIMAAAAKHLTPTILELGGKCPVLVDKVCIHSLYHSEKILRFLNNEIGC